MGEKKTKTKFKTIVISNQLRYILDSYNELEEALEEGWKIYNSGVNTAATPQHNGYIQDNVYNVTWFILTKEVEEEVKEWQQGFLTNEDRFVDREEAFKIAKKAGQLKAINQIDGEPIDYTNETLLYSEYVW